MTRALVRIGGAAGAWGDSPMAIGQLLGAEIDYLMMDYLAEVTMSLLARARIKDAQAGYPPDFIGYLKPHLQEIKRRGIRVVSNAGGVNPRACKLALETAGAALGLDLRVAVVLGDDLLPILDQLRAQDIREWRSGAPLPDKVLTANAYLGALPIAAALADGADMVITGRCADSALALGILMHEFDWQAEDYDRLASGSLVGHLLECGAQGCGGCFTDWQEVPGWDTIGYPIAECRADGEFVLAKPAGTGGLITPATVAEQTLYEIGDPATYVLPDVTADFSQVTLTQVGPDRVQVSGARGRPPTAQFKVSATWQDGWRAVAMLCIVGPQAADKAARTAQALVSRARRHFADRVLPDFTAVHIELLGAEASYGTQSRTQDAREVVLRLVVDHADPRALDLFARELGSVGISFAQGTTGLIGGRPKPTPVVRLHTFLIDKAALGPISVEIADGPPSVVGNPRSGGYIPSSSSGQPKPARANASTQIKALIGPVPTGVSHRVEALNESAPTHEAMGVESMIEVPLIKVAHARSGDKGDLSNIAIFCRSPRYFDHLRSVLTPERIGSHFAEQVLGLVERYEAQGLCAFNFVLDNALGGGGMASQRIDPQGKAYGQRALEMRVRVPAAWFADAEETRQ